MGGVPADLTAWGKGVRERILRDTGLSVSVGVAGSKILAKMAGEYRKPGGVTVVHPGRGDLEAEVFLRDRPAARGQRPHDSGIACPNYRGAELLRASQRERDCVWENGDSHRGAQTSEQLAAHVGAACVQVRVGAVTENIEIGQVGLIEAGRLALDQLRHGAVAGVSESRRADAIQVEAIRA